MLFYLRLRNEKQLITVIEDLVGIEIGHFTEKDNPVWSVRIDYRNDDWLHLSEQFETKDEAVWFVGNFINVFTTESKDPSGRIYNVDEIMRCQRRDYAAESVINACNNMDEED